jgi:hypothetical protein
MVGGSQGVRKVLIYSGFNILLFFMVLVHIHLEERDEQHLL